jgi:hypothetical protein
MAGRCTGPSASIPRYASVAYAELAGNLFLAHRLGELDVAVEQKIVVAAIYKPGHRA